MFDSGFQMQADAFTLLQSASESADPEQIVSILLEKVGKMEHPPIFINRELLEEALPPILRKEKPEKDLLPKVEPAEAGKGIFHPHAREVDAKVDVLKNPSEEDAASTGNVESFMRYFRDRFQRLQKILRQRFDVRGATTIGEALNEKPGTRVKIIGMISEKVSRGKTFIFRVDDLEHTAAVIAQPTSLGLYEKAQAILLDQVVCILGVRRSNDLILAEDFLLPEVPQHKPSSSDEPISVVLTSDFHVGSKLFERKLLERFLQWINGNLGNEKQRDDAGRVKYLVVAGDLADGIGIYPQQEHELEVKDVYKQYEMAAQILEQIPDYVQVILTPGNHDASRKALPQPPISKKYAEPVYRNPSLISLGNPAQVRLHGVNILVHHGRSLEDLMASLPNVNHRAPAMAMVHLLRMRHLAPVYGQRTPIAPEPKDWMVIEMVPDIYHAGHIHVFGQASYRGTQVINSGCWQRQTSYQRKMGVTPTYGIVPVVNLQTLALTSMDFTQM